MDGLSAAASLIAVIEISAKITSLCLQYSAAVKDAKKDIERLQGKVADLRDVLGGVERLLNARDVTRLPTAHRLERLLKDCLQRLEELKARLIPGTTRKTMSRLGVRALKWPFTSKEVREIVVDLERCEQTFILALQVDQTGLTLELDQKIDLAKLPIAQGASFDSHMGEHSARCLENTRVELQRHIAEWARDKNGKPIFWLNGMAGTGKSTIARTVAQSFADQRQLGASFFFKKGEGDRGNATRFFTTIATDLMSCIPASKLGVRKAIDADPAISEKVLKNQFEKLILEPLSELRQVSLQTSELVIVIDALDECDEEEDIRIILQLLAQLKTVKSVSIKVFLTSRPELDVRSSFKQMSEETYQDLILHEVSELTVKRDIALFLNDRLNNTREQRGLSPDWPSKDQIQALTDMAIPLFIFAATACRYIGDKRGNPKTRLNGIIQTANQVSKLDRIYLPILNQLFDDEDETDKEMRINEFREIVGAIVIMESPLSITSLGYLLDMSKEDISCRLELLHSVLNIPNDEEKPVRLLHLSFRDFLLDSQKNGRSPFWIDERQTHERLTSACLRLMSSPKGLRQNMCNLSRPGTLRSEIDDLTIDRCLRPEVQYACRYWVYHLQQSKISIRDNDSEVYDFLQNYFLYWLEAMSIIRESAESVRMINSLQSLNDSNEGIKTADFLHDAKRFALQNRSILENAPLQLYSSALLFAPEMSIIRKKFIEHIPRWATRLSKVDSNWKASLQTLEGHSGEVNAVAISPDGRLLASGSVDSTIKLWDIATGSCHSTLEGHSDWVNAVSFSPDSQLVASGSDDKTVRLWEMTTGSCHSTLEGHSFWVHTVVFSPDGQLVASGSDDNTVRLWDVTTGSCHSTLEGHSHWVMAVSFSPDGQLVASGSHDNTVRLWDMTTGSCHRTLEGHLDRVQAVAFSPDAQLVASGSDDKTVRLWDVTTGSCHSTLDGHSNWVQALAFSPDGQLVASGSYDKKVRLWDVTTGSCHSTLEGHSHWVNAVSFSPDGQLVASGSDDKTVRLWDVTTGSCHSTLEGHSKRLNTVTFSPDGQLAASGSDDKTVRLWEMTTGSCHRTLEGHSDRVQAVAFSPDAQLVASGSDDKTVRLWDVTTGSCHRTLEGHSDRVLTVAFSPDGQLVASGSYDKKVRLWDVTTGSCHSTLEGHSDWVQALAFSPDGQLVASGSDDQTVRLWDVTTGSCHSTLDGHSNWVRALAFSPDGRLVASGSVDETVRLWDVNTWFCRITVGTSHRVRAVAFSSDGLSLTTDAERISLASPVFNAVACQKEPCNLFVADQWVVSADQRLLWLPSEYRPSCPPAVLGNRVWLGHAFGHITILEFDLDNVSA